MAGIVISDTSPIRALDAIGGLGWLNALFSEVIVPLAVSRELLHPPGDLPPVKVQDHPWIIVKAASNSGRVAELQRELDTGEAEAIALAEELRAEWLLIDERAGRKVAESSGLFVMGTLAVILKAREQQLCSQVGPLLDRLQREFRFFISPGLRQQILQRAGESESGERSLDQPG